MSIYQKASRLKVRFDSSKGLLTMEDLWDLPLQSTTGKPNLDAIAIQLHRQLKAKSETTSFVETTKVLGDEELEVKFAVVKDVIETKVAENAAARQAAEKKATKEKLLEAIQRKRDGALESMSLEDLEKMLASA